MSLTASLPASLQTSLPTLSSASLPASHSQWFSLLWCSERRLWKNELNNIFSFVNNKRIWFDTFFNASPIFVYFSSFSDHNSIINWKSIDVAAWESNPGPQDGSCRRIDWAMASCTSLIRLLFILLYAYWDMFIVVLLTKKTTLSRLALRLNEQFPCTTLPIENYYYAELLSFLCKRFVVVSMFMQERCISTIIISLHLT